VAIRRRILCERCPAMAVAGTAADGGATIS
jgi:hypothetical protein